MVAAALTALARRPMSSARAGDLSDDFMWPRQELKRLTDTGAVTRLAQGVYTLTPLGARPGWLPELEVAAMAWATATYGDRIPVLMGLGAARFRGVIPRAIGVTVVALPVQHRPMEIAGGRVVFVARNVEALRARTETTELGEMLVSTPEQTFVDLVARPGLGGMATEADAAAHHLSSRVDLRLAVQLAAQQKRAAPLAKFMQTA